jgi:hypothetical protein
VEFGIGIGTAGMRCLYRYGGVYCVWDVGIVTEVVCNNSVLNELRSYSSSCAGEMQLLFIVDNYPLCHVHDSV